MTHHKVQRDFPQVLALIKAHALLHSCTGCRERGDADGAVIATVEDYAIVRELVEDILAQGLEVAVPENVREIVRAVKEMTEAATRPGGMAWEGSSTVSQRVLADYLGRDISVISRNVRKAIDDGYLEDTNPGQGRTSSIQMGERELPSGHVLPLPEELARVTKPVGELEPIGDVVPA